MHELSSDQDHTVGPVRVIVLFAPTDGDLLGELEAHLSVLECHKHITLWHRGRASAGEDVDVAAQQHVDRAEILVPLISVALLACHQEMNRALEALNAGRPRVVPVLLRPCDLGAAAVLKRLQMVPRNGQAVSSWPERHAALSEVAAAVREVAAGLRRPVAHAVQVINTLPPSTDRPRFTLSFFWKGFALSISLGALLLGLCWRLWRGERIWTPPTPAVRPSDLGMPHVDLAIPLDLAAPPFDMARRSPKGNAAIESKVREIISSQLEIGADKLRPEANFIDDLKVDSLAVVELVVTLEEAFKIEIPDEDTEQIKTLGDAVRYIASHQGDLGHPSQPHDAGLVRPHFAHACSPDQLHQASLARRTKPPISIPKAAVKPAR